MNHEDMKRLAWEIAKRGNLISGGGFLARVVMQENNGTSHVEILPVVAWDVASGGLGMHPVVATSTDGYHDEPQRGVTIEAVWHPDYPPSWLDSKTGEIKPGYFTAEEDGGEWIGGS